MRVPQITQTDVASILPELHNVGFLARGGQKVVFSCEIEGKPYVLKFLLVESPPADTVGEMTMPAFDACQPRSEVISSQLSDAMFAARLNDVVQSKAHPFYQDATDFFSQTHATESMKSFFRQVTDRLRGSGGASAYYRLDTPFGGGKTHSLIALWHLTTSWQNLPEELISQVGVNKGSLPGESVAVRAIVGPDLNPSNGTDKGDGLVEVFIEQNTKTK